MAEEEERKEKVEQQNPKPKLKSTPRFQLVVDDGDVRSGSVCTRTSEVDALQVRQESG
jgi:hypothetical protein